MIQLLDGNVCDMELVCLQVKSTSAKKKKPMKIIEPPISKIMTGRAAAPWKRFSRVFTLLNSTSLRISKIGSHVSVFREGMC